jgi:hypothetical protein
MEELIILNPRTETILSFQPRTRTVPYRTVRAREDKSRD